MLKPLLLLAVLGMPLTAMAQDARIDFGGLSQDTSAPVSVDADSLSVDQATGQALFEGNVRVGQGTMRLAADRVTVRYGESEGEISALEAAGNVTLSNGDVAAEAQEATYTIGSGVVEMRGDVLLTQGRSTIAGQSLRIDLQSGTGTVQGRVQTLFQPGQGE
ncbi:lipopolysaccharide transport periplasmic protein LptA [Falsirhodobacter algicola]|uniref:Lipopolysaccharide transport periplasmic protein LptA n=2 Tax=Falsirhodobacter algicola TaxID=2692330 RepID=A0A8J8MVB4_9RHOB|nr:lipopolysaccharide transport periplasmic protein LptA [Falsirhodobacter algicola]